MTYTAEVDQLGIMMRRASRPVYIVDDDRSFLPAISRLVAAGGFRAVSLRSLAELKGCFPLDPHACILADISLKGESGLNVPALLEANGERATVLFMSATDDTALIEAAKKLTSAPFLRKPVESEVLFDALRHENGQDGSHGSITGARQ